MSKFPGLRIETAFVVTAFAISLTSYLFFRSEIVVQLYDTYIVSTQQEVAQLLSWACIFSFGIYFLFGRFGKPLNERLGYFHFFLTTIPVFTAILLPDYERNALAIPIVIGVILFVIGQIILLINLLRTLLTDGE